MNSDNDNNEFHIPDAAYTHDRAQRDGPGHPRIKSGDIFLLGNTDTGSIIPVMKRDEKNYVFVDYLLCHVDDLVLDMPIFWPELFVRAVDADTAKNRNLAASFCDHARKTKFSGMCYAPGAIQMRIS